MQDNNEQIIANLCAIVRQINAGQLDEASTLIENMHPEDCENIVQHDVTFTMKTFFKQYLQSAAFMQAIANGNLNVDPPNDPLRQNTVISQYKQLHSNLRHLTWQTQQIAKGDLRQKVSFLGDFSIAFNEMIESLREKKRLEEKIKLQNEQLTALNAEKDKFFSIIAHDLRSPFSAFLGFTELMVMELDNLPQNDLRDLATSVRNSAFSLYNLLENLLEWSILQRNLAQFEPQMFLLKPFAAEMILHFNESANKKNIEITLQAPDHLQIVADKNMLGSIIRNLVSNAVKFTTTGGKITVAAKQTANNCIEISVNDTGIGMDEALVGKLFKLAEVTNRRGTHGESSTGLGLFLCKDFVEKHNGTIWVESQAENEATGQKGGTTFYFTIPKIEQQEI